MAALRFATNLAAALAFAQLAVVGASAVEIPAKYRGVYAGGDNCQQLPESESDITTFPWTVVTKDTVYRGGEGAGSCFVTAVRPDVGRNADELTFACFDEDQKSTAKRIWSLAVESKLIWGFRMSQTYLSVQDVGGDPALGGRVYKCALQAAPVKRCYMTDEPGCAP